MGLPAVRVLLRIFLVMGRRAEEGLGMAGGGDVQDSDDLFAIVDAVGPVGPAERAEIGHRAVLVEEGMSLTGRGVGVADDLAAVVDAESDADCAAGKCAEVGHFSVFIEESVSLAARQG